jgi:purine-nucleoside phosphorylase
MLQAYDKNLINKALHIAQVHHIRIHTGVYTALQGPNLETPAEYQFVNRIGGDLIGMSSVPEIIVARHSDMRAMMLSIVSNKCYPIEDIRETTVESVIAVASAAEPKMRLIIKNLLRDELES